MRVPPELPQPSRSALRETMRKFTSCIGRDTRDFTECGKRHAATWFDTYLRNSRQGAKAAKEDKQSFDLSKKNHLLLWLCDLQGCRKCRSGREH
jgi:hypothetical protein